MKEIDGIFEEETVDPNWPNIYSLPNFCQQISKPVLISQSAHSLILENLTTVFAKPFSLYCDFTQTKIPSHRNT